MKTHLSPRQLAAAVGVSESSVKRWADRGLISVERTAGGHRRLPMGGVIQFLRGSELSLLQPQILGLPDVADSAAVPDAAADAAAGVAELVAALEAGDEERFRGAVFRLYLEGTPAAEICDRYLVAAFRQLGDRWHHDRLEVYRERRGVEICRQVLHELRQAVPSPAAGAPQAGGGTLAGDWYSLPTAMVEIALREAGWNARSYGSSHPVETLVAAIHEQDLRLFWLSVSWIGSLDELAAAVERLHRAADEEGAALVLGGRPLEPAVRRRLRGATFCNDLAQLQAFAAGLARS